ncbi:sensor histidine kinase [Sphaerisporangium album]|uniref:histidine kinase n=2 Tax=Sphaerisporangium album TaxID=509200 RepID=A0A367F9I6_9ACTN|nr:sensor histidine kinase [Sphaerisporangium album]
MALLCTAMAMFMVVMMRQAAIDHGFEQLLARAVTMGSQARLQIPDLAKRAPDQTIQIVDPAGVVATATPDMAGRPLMSQVHPDVDAFAVTHTCDGQVFPGRCRIVLVYPFHRHDGVWELLMAAPGVPWYVNSELLVPLVAGWALLVGVTAAGSYRIVSKALEPVCDISGNLARITASDLGHRVPAPRYRDELRDLVETVNRTLDRTQSAVQQQLDFASDASHDLRSPLTAMRTQIEEALMDPHHADWLRTANALLESVERMQALIGDLLQIARLDTGVTGNREAISLTELVQRELDRQPRKVPVHQHLTPGVNVDGERIGLTRLLNNLLDNAERHAESAITVTLELHPGTAVLLVCDDGEGIAPEQREVIFKRFARLKASRVRDPGGTGLGLPIARQIAQLHGGTLTAEDSPRGARLVMRLPLAPAPRQGGSS